MLGTKRVVSGEREPRKDAPEARAEAASEVRLNAKVLVIDDEPALCEILSRYFGWKGLEVKTAQTPADALNYASKAEFDLVILDWDLAGVEALDLLNFFKGMWPETSVIIFTGKHVDEAFLKRVLRGRADAIVRKLGSFDSLWREVIQQLQKRKRGLSTGLMGPGGSERR